MGQSVGRVSGMNREDMRNGTVYIRQQENKVDILVLDKSAVNGGKREWGNS